MAIVVAILEFCWNSKRNAQQEKVHPILYVTQYNQNDTGINVHNDKQSWMSRSFIRGPIPLVIESRLEYDTITDDERDASRTA